MQSRGMRSYLSLIPISARTRGKQNRLTLMCIILAVFLVTSVFSLAEIMTKGQAEASLRKHGNYHIAVSGISVETAGQIAEQGDVAVTAWCRTYGGRNSEGWYTADGRRIILYGADPSYVYDIHNYEREGVYPQNDNEIMLSVNAKELFGVQAGDSIAVDTPAGAFPYTVSGFCVDDLEYNESFEGVCGYVQVSALEDICAANGLEGSPEYYIQFAPKTNLREAIGNIRTKYHLEDGQVDENTMVVGLAGASSNQNINQLYLVAAAVFCMILVAGVLMISSCMNSNVAQRTKFFGMMRCIGASRKQIMRFVRLEALNWCRTAIPAGCGAGVLTTWILCALLQNLVGGEFRDYPFRFSVIGIVSGALVGVVTVLFAAHSPAKRAAGVSPVAAVSGSADAGKKNAHAANTRLFRVESALGVYHAVSAKKNLVLMSLSFAFTVTLFLAFFAGLDFVKRLLPSESNFTPDISVASADSGNSIDRNLKKEMEKVSGVKSASGCMIALDLEAKVNGSASRVDLVSYDEFLLSMSVRSVVSGDLSKIDGDTDYALAIFNHESRLNTGDRIRIGDTELEIACVVSEGIGGWGRPQVVLTEETFARITGEDRYALMNVMLSRDATEETTSALQALVGENEFVDRREEETEMHSSFWVFRLGAYGFLAIIALITVFNIMNSISMSVSARIRQYGAMRAVGMSTRQLTKMITAEAATYAVCGLVIGCAAGLYLNWLLTMKLIVKYFGGAWKLPLEPVIIILVLFALACAAAVYAPAKRIHDMAVTETINEL